MATQYKNDSWFLILFGLLLAIYSISAFLVPVMEPDAAIYAEIAREMLHSGQWTHLTYDGYAFLDKPHLPFWLTATSFGLFGVNDFAYKFPALLCSLMALLYTWKFARMLFGSSVAKTSVLILASSVHFLINLNDVRAEPYLIAFMLAAVFHFIKWTKEPKFVDLVFCAIASALAMMTKGLFALIPVLAVMFGYLLVNWRQWLPLTGHFFIWLGLTLVFLTPSLLAYWIQFDSDPSKTHNLLNIGVQDEVSGIRFFLWDSQIGRFFNDGPITTKDSANPMYFVEAMIWAFWPWSLFWFLCIFIGVFKIKQISLDVGYLLWASVPLFVLFSMSSFQLPHYVVVIFPFFAMGCGLLIHHHRVAESRVLLGFNHGFALLMLVIVSLASYLMNDNSWGIALCCIVTFLACYGVMLRFRLNQIQTLSLLGVTANLLVASLFYPPLLKYQSAVHAADKLHEDSIEQQYTNLPIHTYEVGRMSLEYRLDKDAPKIRSLDEIFTPAILLTNDSGYNAALNKGAVKVLSEHCDYPVTRLTSKFLFPETRSKKCKTHFLLHFEPSTP